MGESSTSPYRYSRRRLAALKRRVLVPFYIALIGGIVVAAIGFVMITATEDDPSGVTDAGGVICIVGMVAAGAGLLWGLFGGAWIGGQAIRRGGGWIGIALVVGILSAALHEVVAQLTGSIALGVVALDGGIALIVLAGVAFWVVGWIAKVPMWIQAPIVRSPRWHIHGPDERYRSDESDRPDEHRAPEQHTHEHHQHEHRPHQHHAPEHRAPEHGASAPPADPSSDTLGPWRS